jgi:hypothetical protein
MKNKELDNQNRENKTGEGTVFSEKLGEKIPVAATALLVSLGGMALSPEIQAKFGTDVDPQTLRGNVELEKLADENNTPDFEVEVVRKQERSPTMLACKMPSPPRDLLTPPIGLPTAQKIKVDLVIKEIKPS